MSTCASNFETEPAALLSSAVVHEPSHRELALRTSLRAVSRGVTLVEVLIVVSIMALISSAVVVAVIPRFRGAQIDTATSSAREVRNAVTRYRARGSDTCPTPAMLVQEKEIDTASKIDDPWNSPFKIECVEDEVYVTSFGPDKKEGTADDISVPKKAAR